jgi:hypothetical protein
MHPRVRRDLARVSSVRLGHLRVYPVKICNEIHGSLQEDFAFKITFGEENNLLIEIPVSRKDVLAAQAQAIFGEDNPAEDTERLFNIRMPVVLGPFVIDKPGRLRVRAHYKDGKI